MNLQRLKSKSDVIIYDAAAFADAGLSPSEPWFRPEYWAQQGFVTAKQPGRGTALTVDTPVGSCVLRQYLRGGVVSRFIRSKYVFTGYENSRPLSEFRVLARCAELELPCPRPIAAFCKRHLISATGAILTREIEDVRPLERVADSIGEAEWRSVGAVIRQFHDQGLVHADLNVRNIIMQDSGKVFLVDFDRARFQTNAHGAFRRNLQRLHRSMVKSKSQKVRGFNEQAWTQLLKGYG